MAQSTRTILEQTNFSRTFFENIFMKKDKSLQDARQQWVLSEIENMKLANPVAELADKMGYGKSLISEVLNKKAAVSLKFFQTFCEQFGFDVDTINHQLIDGIKNSLHADKKILAVNNFDENDNVNSFNNQNTTDMENFLKDQIVWQRGLIELLARKIPDAEQVIGQSEPAKKQRGA